MTIGKDEKVIKVIVNRAGFEYDIHALVKSFYPGWDVQIKEEDEPVLEPGTADILIWIREDEVQIALAEPEREGQPFAMGSRELFRDDNGQSHPAGNQEPDQAAFVSNALRAYRETSSLGDADRDTACENFHEFAGGRKSRE